MEMVPFLHKFPGAHMIIECPSCKTKFALGSHQLSGVTNPRFHCSRCGNIFNSEEMNSEDIDTRSQPTATSAVNEAEQLALIPEVATPIEPVESVAVERMSTLNQFHEETFPPVRASWPDSRTDTVYEADMRTAIESHLAGETLAARRPAFLARAQQAFQGPVETPTAETPLHEPLFSQPTQVAEQPAPAPITPTSQKFVSGPDLISSLMSNRKIERSVVPQERTLPSMIDDLAPISRPQMKKRPLRPNVSFSEYFRPIVTFCTPPLVVCAVLFSFGESIVESQPVLRSLSSIVPTALEKAPPAGVDMTNVKHEFLTLEDGHRVLEITGRIQNSTEMSLNELKVEAKVFDAAGKALSTLVINPDNGLMNATRITALPESSLTALQSKRNIGNPSMSAGESRMFRVVFSDVPEGAHTFSARIYSVTPALES